MRTVVFLSITLLSTIGAPIAATPQDGSGNPWEYRWIMVRSHFRTDDEVERVKGIINRAANAGFNGVVVHEDVIHRIDRFGTDRDDNLVAVRRHAADLGMHFTLTVFPLGYCHNLLYNDPALVAGYPIVDMPLRRIGNELVPLATSSIDNGSFENHKDDEFDGWWTSRDKAGVASFADSVEGVSGSYSLRFENFSEANVGIYQTINVVPFQQYRLKFWFRTEHLTADWVGMYVYGADDDGHIKWDRRVSSRHLSYPSPYGDGLVRTPASHFEVADDLTLDWTEAVVSFNSLEHTNVAVTLNVSGYGGGGGRIWWDDIRIDAAPTLNVIRRANLPLKIVGPDGFVYREGVDFDPISDPKMGRVIWGGGYYDTHHTPPTITIAATSSIGSGGDVYFSGYHVMLGPHGEAACSMSDTGVYDLLDTVIREAEAVFFPDGYFLWHTEVRTGGWEPDQVGNYRDTGEVLAAHIAEVTNRVDTLTGKKPLVVWSDMFNPHQNAVERYYHVNNTLEGSWLGLPTSVRVVNWSFWNWEVDVGSVPIRRESLRFFEERGHEQIIAGYYDEDVIDNYEGWMAAADGVSNVTGVMFTSWTWPTVVDSDLELFAKTWWGGRGHQLVGGRLYGGDFVQAERAACRLVFQTDGNLVAYSNGEEYWSAGTQAAARGGWAEMQADGNFVVYDAAGVAQWSTGTVGNPDARVVMEDDCNVVVSAPGGAQLWASGRPQ